MRFREPSGKALAERTAASFC